MAIEHVFIGWDGYEKGRLSALLQGASGRNRWPLVTLEPWTFGRRPSDGHSLFVDVLTGRYDAVIGTICGEIRDFGKPVFVRWGHEMEAVTGRYPWARADAQGYVRAYRHFVDSCRAAAQNAFYVWSPVGNDGLDAYWPGRSYADYVGLSVYGFPEWDLAHFGRVRSFDEIFVEKYLRIARFTRPVMIAELGVAGEREHQVGWITDGVRNFGRYPLLRSVVYFNAVDSRAAWPEEFSIPDWRLDLGVLTLGFPLLNRLLSFADAIDSTAWTLELQFFRYCRAYSPLCPERPLNVNFGAYDPEKHSSAPLAIEHVFVRWDANERAHQRQELATIAARGRWPLVTLEPWPAADRTRSEETLFVDVVSGRYDSVIDAICGDLRDFGKPVFVRWGQEMEVVPGRYPWARADPSGYIAAYRHVVDRCRSLAGNVFYVWSPAGEDGLRAYWPGRPYADYVGLSVSANRDSDSARLGLVRSFDEIFLEKYQRVVEFKRPVMIADLRVTGGPTHQRTWLTQALRNLHRYPLLRSVVYFNAVENDRRQPENASVVDWRTSLDIFPPG
jgi:beta-mannanase